MPDDDHLQILTKAIDRLTELTEDVDETEEYVSSVQSVDDDQLVRDLIRMRLELGGTG